MQGFSTKKQVMGFIGWLLVSFTASTIGAIASIQARSFYSGLIQPDWAPPGWVFGPVWSTLYLFMAIAAWLVWRKGGISLNRIALGLFLVQLATNAIWSWFFFVWQLGAIALLNIVILWILILATMVAFWQVQRFAAVLLVPYLAWVSFAGFLNYAVWQLNPTILG
ncbi:MAG: tryptophan-rich sensory protein [Thiotrichales bacterium]|nr:tryptophan-rich sensory protein [Thiotrichales bacterium]